MPETKANITQLFKKGIDFELKQVDYSAPKKQQEIRDLNHLRDEVRKSAEVDLTKLKNTVFKI
jgi:hypothetical protein